MKAVISSLMFLNNYKTIFIHFILTPLINIIFISTINNQFTNETSINLLIASLSISISISIITNINTSLVYDYNNEIFNEIIFNSKYSFYYWGTKIFVIILIALLILIINTIILLIYGIDIEALQILYILTPFLILNSVIVGIVLSISSINFKNPYFLTNIISVFAFIIFGAIGSYTLYPSLFKVITFIFPFARIFAVIYQDNFNLIIIDYLILFIWLISIIPIYRFTINNIKNSGKQNFI